MNDIGPELVRRTHQEVDADDLAATFAKEEVGSFDFKNNWEALKRRTDIHERIRLWLEQLNIETSTKEVVQALERLASRSGRWR